jgi:peroxiredoxin
MTTRLLRRGVLFLLLLAPHFGGLPSLAAQELDSNDPQELLREGNRLLRARRYEEALKVFKRANKLRNESCVDCLWGMAQSFEALGAFKNVIETCDRILALDAADNQTRARAYNMKGVSLNSLAGEKDDKKLSAAESAFRSSLQLSGVVLIRLHRDPEGIEQLRQYVARASSSPNLAEARRIIEDPRRARENFAPDFSLTTLQGEYIHSDDLRGKVVLVDFWGTWCPPCVASIPDLIRTHKRFARDPFVLISVSSDSDSARWREFVESKKMTWPQFLDERSQIIGAFQVRSFPTYLVIDHEGIIRYRSSGYGPFTSDDVEDAIRKSLKALAKAGPIVRTQPAASAPPAPAAPPSPEMPASGAARKTDTPAVAPPVPVPLPPPRIEISLMPPFEGSGTRFHRFRVEVENWNEYAPELFQESAQLPPCGRAARPATRLQVSIRDVSGPVRMMACNVPHAAMLRSLIFYLREDEPAPEKIYLLLEDHLTGRQVKSEPVALPEIQQK